MRHLRTGVALFVAAAASGCGGSSYGTLTPILGGTLYYSQEGNPNGLFILSTTTGAGTPVGQGLTGTTGTSSTGLTEAPGGLIGSTPDEIVFINPNGSSATTLPGTEDAEGLAYHAPNGLLYATRNGVFKSVNAGTGVLIATLAAPGADLEGLASDAANHCIYAVGESPSLHRYDVATNTWSVVGAHGLASMNDAGLAFDPNNRILYAVVNSTLYRLDPATGAATAIGPTGLDPTLEAGGLAFVPES
jgi:hypothetical protein